MTAAILNCRNHLQASTFNELPHIDSYSFDDTIAYKIPARRLCNVLIKHEVNDILGVTLNHNHFDIADGEAVVMKWTATPTGNQIMAASVQPLTEDLLPFQWMDDGSTFIPITFVEPDFPGAKAALHRLQTNADNILKDFRVEMKSMHILPNTLGVCLYLEAAESKKWPGMVIAEHTDEVTRDQVYLWEPKEWIAPGQDTELKPVMWSRLDPNSDCLDGNRRCCSDSRRGN